jgi:hypothetical protein
MPPLLYGPGWGHSMSLEGVDLHVDYAKEIEPHLGRRLVRNCCVWTPLTQLPMQQSRRSRPACALLSCWRSQLLSAAAARGNSCSPAAWRRYAGHRRLWRRIRGGVARAAGGRQEAAAAGRPRAGRAVARGAVRRTDRGDPAVLPLQEQPPGERFMVQLRPGWCMHVQHLPQGAKLLLYSRVGSMHLLCLIALRLSHIHVLPRTI